jgi:hypothetical protein
MFAVLMTPGMCASWCRGLVGAESPVDRNSVDTSLVRGVHDIEVVEDPVDVVFP